MSSDEGFWRRVAVLVAAVWWGGLTLYAGVVVPIGTDLLGSTEQGFVTQRVTHGLNALAAATLVVSLRWVLKSRSLRMKSVWSLQLACLVGLLFLHPRLDGLLDETTRSLHESDRFYQVHRVYLWVTMVQWLSGAGLLWGLSQPSPAVGSQAGS